MIQLNGRKKKYFVYIRNIEQIQEREREREKIK